MGIGAALNGGYGASIGLGIWNLIDVAALHYKTEPVNPPPTTGSIINSWTIVPMIGNGRQGLTLIGQF